TGKDCKLLPWSNHGTGFIKRANTVVAIIYDATTSAGHVRTFNSKRQYLDMVGKDYEGYVAVVLGEGQQFACFGDCRIAIVEVIP
ncbi:hypothetical protein JX266_014466, partial [Neoarthrinium moseri]